MKSFHTIDDLSISREVVFGLVSLARGSPLEGVLIVENPSFSPYAELGGLAREPRSDFAPLCVFGRMPPNVCIPDAN